MKSYFRINKANLIITTSGSVITSERCNESWEPLRVIGTGSLSRVHNDDDKAMNDKEYHAFLREQYKDAFVARKSDDLK